jgi:hypothetical protein
VGICRDLHQLGAHVFIFDYRGYGRSRGFPTESGTYRDARAAYEVVRARYADADQPPVLLYGRSLGGAVAVQLALDRPVRGVVLEGAFTSTRDMARMLFPGLPLQYFCRFQYDALAKIRGLQAPKLLAHSRDDEVVPPAMGRTLFEAAAEPKLFYELRGGHNDIGWNTDPGYGKALEQFVRRCLQ